MNTHSMLGLGLSLPPYIPAIGKGENPFQFEWVDQHHQRAIVRLLTPLMGADRKRRCPEAEAVLAWLLDAASGAQTIKKNQRKELQGHHWLWRSYDELVGVLFIDRDQVQKGVGLLRDNGLLIMDQARIGQGPGKTPCFRLTDPALRVVYLLAHWWWRVRGELEESAHIDGGKADPARRAKLFYRRALAAAYNPPNASVLSLPELYQAWLITKDTAEFEAQFEANLLLSAKAAGVTL